MRSVYDQLNAAQLFGGWTSTPFQQVHDHSLTIVPANPSNVIDIGAGSGRDAQALAALGHRVVAVEPWAEMRETAARLNGHPNITWLDDWLPDLVAVKQMNITFEFILVSAVWMHLNRCDRVGAMATLRAIADPSGASAVITLRHPPDKDRGMFSVGAAEVAADANRLGFKVLKIIDRPDPGHRPGVTWSILQLSAGRHKGSND